ncbi:TadE/TadG family type IV pilus assembly protein [Sphingomonas bacterium]|uniref:TadE/TadG family type IV pilus assembly protein n=1 Tax=Sphingomonas bacterium TaxID=1895847 RepID=UPI0015751C28|nr:TadE/TadG family type IV pilus assembly protein [Sphingomonas bacterium]
MNWLGKLRGTARCNSGGFLTRLARHRGGNTLAIMAAALIPMIALTGSAVDTARLYVVKVRLQQACDAGALAGRKTMDTTASATTPPNLDANATTQARAFFANNFISGYMGTPAFTSTTSPYPFTVSKTADYQVSATATTTVPMTLMKMLPFGMPAQTLTVTCQARYDVADTDIVFVLDTTGSMSCLPSQTDPQCDSYVSSAGTTAYTHPTDSSLGAASGSTGSANDSVAGYPGSTGYYVPEQSGSRISAVRQAVVNFYNTVASNADPSTHIRYGFVTYSSTVNAGKAIMSASPSYMLGGAGTNGSNLWTYQSRYIDPTNTASQYQVSQSSAYDSTPNASCNGSTRTPAVTGSQPYTFDTTSRATVVSKSWDSSQNKCKVTTTVYGPNWTYGPASYDVSSFLSNTSVTDPSKLDGTTSSWQGCIEERQTTAGTSSFSNSSLPPDLDPDLIPDSDPTRWKPMWPQIIYWRNYGTLGNGWYGNTTNVMDTSANAGDTDKTAYYSSNNVPSAFSFYYYGSGNNANYFQKAGLAPCGKPIRRVSTMTQQDVTNYVNATDFVPQGGTYHDAGMIWGTRLLSTSGVFASDVGAWPGRQPTNKIIVFLTDGSMSPSLTSYSLYGLEYFDKRVTNGDYAPPAAASPNTQQTAYHNARFLAECSKAKSMNINVWTVMITTNGTPTTQLSQCATTTAQALVSSSGSDLNAKFQAIAKQVAMLRISQ